MNISEKTTEKNNEKKEKIEINTIENVSFPSYRSSP